MAARPDQIVVDVMLVADSAQSMGRKISLLGGGWTHLLLTEVPGKPPLPFAVAVGVLVPWSSTNQPFDLTVELRDADGVVIDETAHVPDIEQGRPPGLRPGTDQRLFFAFPFTGELPDTGRYVFHALIDRVDAAQVAIEAILQPTS